MEAGGDFRQEVEVVTVLRGEVSCSRCPCVERGEEFLSGVVIGDLPQRFGDSFVDGSGVAPGLEAVRLVLLHSPSDGLGKQHQPKRIPLHGAVPPGHLPPPFPERDVDVPASYSPQHSPAQGVFAALLIGVRQPALEREDVVGGCGRVEPLKDEGERVSKVGEYCGCCVCSATPVREGGGEVLVGRRGDEATDDLCSDSEARDG